MVGQAHTETDENAAAGGRLTLTSVDASIDGAQLDRIPLPEVPGGVEAEPPQHQTTQILH